MCAIFFLPLNLKKFQDISRHFRHFTRANLFSSPLIEGLYNIRTHANACARQETKIQGEHTGFHGGFGEVNFYINMLPAVALVTLPKFRRTHSSRRKKIYLDLVYQKKTKKRLLDFFCAKIWSLCLVFPHLSAVCHFVVSVFLPLISVNVQVFF